MNRKTKVELSFDKSKYRDTSGRVVMLKKQCCAQWAVFLDKKNVFTSSSFSEAMDKASDLAREIFNEKSEKPVGVGSEMQSD